MNKRQWGRLTFTIIAVVGMALAGFGGTRLMISSLDQNQPTNARTQALIDGPVVPEITCTDSRDAEGHTIYCSISTGVDGAWLVREYINGVAAPTGRSSNFLMSAWSFPIASSINPTVIVTYMSDAQSDIIQLIYTMDIEYMRTGLNNFGATGDNAP